MSSLLPATSARRSPSVGEPGRTRSFGVVPFTIDTFAATGRFAGVPQLADLIAALDTVVRPRLGRTVGRGRPGLRRSGRAVERVLLAVDPVPATVDEAIGGGAQLLITHHPLLLTAVHGVPADDPKGALVHRMIRGRVAHFVAHTNADVADPGVSDALADRLGLTGLRPLVPSGDSRGSGRVGELAEAMTPAAVHRARRRPAPGDRLGGPLRRRPGPDRAHRRGVRWQRRLVRRGRRPAPGRTRS